MTEDRQRHLKDLVLRGLLAAESIGIDYEDADEAWQSLYHGCGDDPDFEVADRAFVLATGGEHNYSDPPPEIMGVDWNF